MHKIFQLHEIFNVTMKTNATSIENVQNWLNDLKFEHIKYIAIGAKVMITEVINISKGAINGRIVIITSLTFDDNKMVTRVTNHANLMT
jgi:intracellular sulfur oxidation DsrE/DsrF family protein